MEHTNTSDYSLLDNIKKGDERQLSGLYGQYRSKFLNWARQQYQVDEDIASEVYQKAFCIFYFNIKNGKLTELTSSLETYFYGISKNVFRERYKDKYKKYTTEMDDRFELGALDTSITDKYTRMHQKETVQKLLDNIGDTCKQILQLYYFKKYTMEAIANTTGYKNEMVAKKKKYQCLKGLREKVGSNRNLIEQLLG